jgi:sulfite reductase (NADPH) flavoprotein alpha-component
MTDQSPVAATAIIPESAPFSADQRAWLNGFFAGLMSLDAGSKPATAADLATAGGGMAARAASADGDDGAEPWHDPAMAIDERMTLATGRPLRRKMMAAMAQQDCGQCGYNCEDYANAITDQAEARLNLCVPGGKATARMLKSLVEDMGGGVIDAESAAAKPAAPLKSQDTRPGRSRETPVAAALAHRTRLNGEGSEKVTNHIEIDLSASGLDYEPGDSLGVIARNDEALADRIIKAISAPPDFPIAGRTLRDALIDGSSLSPAPDALFQLISYLTGGQRKKKALALAKGEDPDGDAATLDVLAALEKFQGLHPDPEAFIEVLDPLQPRLYSISSSLKANPGRVSLTVDTVRYDVGQRERLGVASTYLGTRAPLGSPVQVYVQKAHGFALPVDASTPIIMVGPGTGVAPFRSFLQERNAVSAPGRAWLFYGHQRQATDFFYESEFAEFLRAGSLTRLSTAWSRDGTRKTYVQDKMREDGGEVFRWLEDGAHFYICGDAKRMAKDVETVLNDIIKTHGSRSEADAAAYIAGLKKSGRYQADVY